MAATNPGSAGFEVYCNLDEAGGSNALDSSPNGHDLTETGGTIESTDGGREFAIAHTEWFEKADHADYSFGDEDFSMGGWVKLAAQATDQSIIAKYDSTNDDREYFLRYGVGSDRYEFRVNHTGLAGATVTANNYGAVPATTKAFVLGWHDSAANKTYISINNGAADEAASQGCNDNISPLQIGALNGAAPTNYMGGILWSCFIARKVFTANEREWLYNAGVPRKWSEIYFVPKVVFLCDFGKTCKKVNGLWRPRNLGLSGA